MTETRTMAGVVLAFIVGAILFILTLPGEATTQPDDYPDNYIEECDVYRNHSGFIPGYYDYAVFFEQGQEPIHVETYGEPVYLAPPDGESWDRVYKCKRDEETTTTTTVEETTTTVADTTTTTAGEETTTTEQDTTTTTGEESTTTTVTDSTTTTDPGTPPELPFTGTPNPMPLILVGLFLLSGGLGIILRKTRA